MIHPKRGPTFVLLSTGFAGTFAPEPGIDFAPIGTLGDQVTLTLQLNLPPGATRLSFDFNFLSAEFPDYVGTVFNDSFSAVLTDSSGVHEIARSSVNSAAFIAASASNAGGSGFDIFTEDPADVDTDFPGGLPDAGLTGFRSVNVPLAGGGPATLTLTIADLGDGILDSAVVLDNLVISSVEIVDPNPQFLSGGEVIGNTETLAKGGDPREAAAADGVTKVLLRASVEGPGTMQFCLHDAIAPVDGGLLLIGGSGRANCVTALVVNTSQGFRAYALYHVPLTFNRGGDETLGERSFSFRGRFMSDDGDIQESETPFKIVRPPVVLVHGLWSGSGTWTFPLATDARFSVTLADYTGTNASHFSTNLLVPFTYIREAVVRERLNNDAATQVDIAGHSMGGILSRNHTSLPNYERNDNFNAGDLHTLMTLNTPHTGSPLGNLIQGIRAIPVVGGIFESGMAAINHPVDQGAIEDLAKGSAAIGAIQHTPVPGHALVGTGGSDALTLIPGPIGTIYTVINFFADLTGLFEGLQHDGIVGRRSQEGGMPAGATTVFGGLSSIHTSVTGNSAYSARLVELLNSSPTGAQFAEFPAPAGLPLLSPVGPRSMRERFPTPVLTRVSTAGSLTITSPPDGTQVAPGQIVHVTVQPGLSQMIDRVLLTGPEVAKVDDAAPFEIDLAIPDEADGRFPLFAIGHDTSGSFVTSNTVTLRVVPSAALTSVSILPRDPILFAIAETRALTVLGHFNDGITRDISRSETGTSYLTSDGGIAGVSSQGIVSAAGRGGATIVARNGSVQDSVSVRVELANIAPVADAGPNQTVPVGAFVTLDGTHSSDPDSGPEPLKFEWTQIAGPAVFLAGAATATPSFTASVAGSYTFSLVVNDGATDSLPASVTVRAGLPELTELSPARIWIGLKNGDDTGTQFDLKVELLKNGAPVGSGLKRCVTGVARNPASAKEAVVAFDAFGAVPVVSGDVLALRASTRIGTNPDGTKCSGPGGSHNSAVGLRLYYDAASRASRFDATITPDASRDLYLHSNGGVCGSAESSGVTTRFLDGNAPVSANAKCKDSGAVNFSGGNPFSAIGTWSLAPLP